MKLQRSSRKRKARIEIIPLIDIIFFLLATFVMVSLSMVKNSGVPVNLPTATTAVPQERKNSVTISVTKSGDIYLDKQLSTRNQLQTQLAVWKARETDPRVFIYGDEETPFKNLMSVMDTVRSAGITKVAMQTRPANLNEGKNNE
jgi:biopolymer transport protein ExbD